jgi:uncharacterized protein (TIGR00369 family)
MDEVLLNNDHCFCCGSANEQGLKLHFTYPSRGKACTELVIPAYFSGWKDMVHGGLLSMLLDEAMAYACGSGNLLGVTAELSVRFLKPVKTGETIRIEGELIAKKSKLLETQGFIKNSRGELIAKATGRFISMKPQAKAVC